MHKSFFKPVFAMGHATLFLVLTASLRLLCSVCAGNVCSDYRVNYIQSSECVGKRGTSYVLASYDNMVKAECVTRCDKTFGCMLIFHNAKTGQCNLHSRSLADISKTTNVDFDCFIGEDGVESWVDSIVSRSYNEASYEDFRMIGDYSSGGHWHSPYSGSGYIQFRIATAMYIERVHIYQTHVGSGSGVNEISLLTPEGTLLPVWSRNTPDSTPGGLVLSPPLLRTHFTSSELRISVDKHIGIYAVKVSGRRHLTIRTSP